MLLIACINYMNLSQMGDLPANTHLQFEGLFSATTLAARMPEHIPDKVKSARSEVIREFTQDNKLKYRKSFIGKQQQVLIEKIDDQGFCSWLRRTLPSSEICRQRPEEN
jgi:tRNA A37 methylthiotransferase MiaB